MRTLASLKQMTLFEFRSLMRNRIALLFNLVIPVVLVAVLGSMLGNTATDRPSPIGWIDQDRGPVAERLHSALDATKRFQIVTGDEAELRAQLAKGALRSIVILPEDLSEKAAADAVPEVAILRDLSSTASNADAGALYNLIGRVGAEMSGARPLLVPAIHDLPGMDRFGFFDFLVPGQLVYMLLAGGMMSVALNLAQHRQTGSLRHLFTTPLSMGVWAAAQMFANVVLAGLQIVVLFTAARLLFGVHAPHNLPATIVALIICSLTSLSMGLAMGAALRSVEATLPAAIVLFFLLAMFGNAVMPLDGAPDFMLSVQKVMPSLYMSRALRLTMMQGKGLSSILGDLTVLVSCMLAFGGLALWRIRKQMTAA